MLPYVDIGRYARLKNVVIDRGVQIPEGLVVGEDPELDAQRFRRTDKGIVPDHPADDRPAGRLRTLMRVLSVASEVFPADQDRRARRRRRRLAGGAGAAGVEMRTLVPGYPAVLRSARADGGARPSSADLFGGPARLLAGAAPTALDLLVLDAPHLYDRPGNPYLGPDGSDWPDNYRRFAPARPGRGARSAAARARRLAARHRPWPRLAGRAGAGLSALRAASRGPATVLTVHNLAFQGLFPAELLRRARPAAAGLRGRRRRVSTAGVGFLKAGLYFADRLTTVSPTYAAGDPDRRPSGMGLDGLLRARARRSARHRQRHRRPTSGTRRPTRHLAAPYDAAQLDRPRGQQGGASQAALRPRRRARRAAVHAWSAG